MTVTDVDDDPRRTRPGTPMIGDYSVNQMDDFYAAITAGQVKPTGIMNMMQRLIIAGRCKPGDKVVDACCGAGLQLPMLYQYRPDLGSYLGLDINPANQRSFAARQRQLDAHHGPQFPIEFSVADVSQPWEVGTDIDVVIYTSALEHLPREAALASLRHAAGCLNADGVLLLSTPNTAAGAPLQHRVHVHEWSHEELRSALDEIGLVVDEEIGILAPSEELVTETLAEAYGPGAASLYATLKTRVPHQLLDPIVAAAIGDAATEILYVCVRKLS
ncbi:class I SAM-dependent methyltransferase [Nocardia goodfellowii]